MVAEPLVEVSCGVCGGEPEVICSAREVAAHLEYLRRFHRRRLRMGAPSSALADRAEFTQDYATDIVACRRCGLVFRNPRPTDRAIASAYQGDTYGLQRLSQMFDSQVDLARPKAQRLERHLGRLQPQPPRVVEVGSFVGGFLRAGQERGWDMLGVDPGEEVGLFCSERELPVFRGTLEDVGRSRWPAGWNPGTVDCVAIWNAFDQLPSPEATLASARRLLRPGGVLALRVPNGQCFRWAAGWMRRLPLPWGGWLRAAMAWNNLLAFPYLHGYGVRTLDWLLGWHGFTRIAAEPDTLCRLADEETRPWAHWEERGLKLLSRAASSLQALRPSSALHLSPWLDVYYRRTEAR